MITKITFAYTLVFFLISLGTIPVYGQQSFIKENLPYVTDGGHKQQLDLYLPADAEDFPTILFVHEGSLTSGDRKDEPYADMCKTLNSFGIACAAMSYRLAPEHKWPAQPDDVASAFSWLKKNMEGHGGNTDQLFLFGHSSGCLLVSLVGSDSTYLQKQGYSLADIAGIIPMGCRLNDQLIVSDTKPEWYEMYSVRPADTVKFAQTDHFDVYNSLSEKNNAVPTKHVSANLPPTLILIGEHERFFPPVLRDAAEFTGRALVAGAEADIKILQDRTHMTAIRKMTTRDDMAIQLVVDFVLNTIHED